MITIKVPYLAEGVNTGTVVNLFVKEGDKVKKNQDLFELETEKAVTPIPSPEAGTVTKIHVRPGDKVAVGQGVITLQEEGASSQTAKPQMEAPKPAPRAPAPPGAPSQAAPASAPSGYTYESKSGFPPPASPSIRKMARDLGIDLTRVRGSEAGGRITLQDLRNYVAGLQQRAFQAAPRPEAPSVDFSKWGPVRRQPMTNLRKKISGRMVQSWTTIPHVTQYEDADLTRVMSLRTQYPSGLEKKGVRLTVTSFILKALAQVLKQHPIFNTSLDENTDEIIFKEYIHLGIAVDTEQGLVVPVMRHVDKKNLAEISKELADLAERTRRRKVRLEELQGGTFTVSNQGGIGGAHFTPIVNKPEVAILGLGQGRLRPVVVKQKIEPRMILPLALSYDHRVIDGADAARFIKDLVEAIENFSESHLKVESREKRVKGKKNLKTVKK